MKTTITKEIKVNDMQKANIDISTNTITVRGFSPEDACEIRFTVYNYDADYVLDALDNWEKKKIVEHWMEKQPEQAKESLNKIAGILVKDEDEAEQI